jgi:hypothetical protein
MFQPLWFVFKRYYIMRLQPGSNAWFAPIRHFPEIIRIRASISLHLQKQKRRPFGRLVSLTPWGASGDPELVNLVGMRIDYVHGACDAGIEGVDGPQDFQRLLGVRHWRADERVFHRPFLS